MAQFFLSGACWSNGRHRPSGPTGTQGQIYFHQFIVRLITIITLALISVFNTRTVMFRLTLVQRWGGVGAGEQSSEESIFNCFIVLNKLIN